MATKEELDQLSSKELHDKAMHLAKHRLDVGFLWELLRTIPAAEAVSGDEGEAVEDAYSLTARIGDFMHDDEGTLADALRPMFIDYIAEHEK